jgi:hypothetical protein
VKEGAVSGGGGRAGTIAAVAETVATLTVLVWIGGVISINAFTGHTLFHELGRAQAAATMSTIFHAFDELIAWAVGLLAVATAARGWALGLRGRADRIALAAAAALVLLGVLDVAYIHREINALYAADQTLDPRFVALHATSRRSIHLEMLATVLLLGGFAFARRRSA